MMDATYRLNANELTIELLDAIRMLFKDKKIEINVAESFDETDYLLSSPVNKERLLESIKDLEQGKGTEMTIEELHNRFGIK